MNNKQQKITLCAALGVVLSGIIVYVLFFGGAGAPPPIQKSQLAPAPPAAGTPLSKDVPAETLAVEMPKSSIGQLPPLPELPELPVSTPAVPEPAPAETVAVEPEPEPSLTIEEEEEIYYRAMVFRDEALETFPVHTVQVHTPESINDDSQTGKIVKSSKGGPKDNEIWIRVKPGSSGEVREIMAQAADLYRQFSARTDKPVTVVNWVGSQPWNRMVFGGDGEPAQ